MDIAEPDKAALTAELKAIKTRLEKAIESEKDKLTHQFGQRVAHLEARLGIAPPSPSEPAPKAG